MNEKDAFYYNLDMIRANHYLDTRQWKKAQYYAQRARLTLCWALRIPQPDELSFYYPDGLPSVSA